MAYKHDFYDRYCNYYEVRKIENQNQILIKGKRFIIIKHLKKEYIQT